MESFVSRRAKDVIGTLSGFDRIVFRGTLRALILRDYGMARYLWANKVLLKDFGTHAQQLSTTIKEASSSLAERLSRPLRYLTSSAASKEEIARGIAAADKIEEGLICVLSAVEPCLSFEVVRDREKKQLRLVPRRRKCLHLYHYSIDPELGFMHARIQTWFPFSIHVCANGREWLARQMTKAGLGYLRRDNCFAWLQDDARAQQLMNEQLKTAWPALLNRIARTLNPHHDEMFHRYPAEYYWSIHQSEWATDILFKDCASLAGLYPKLVHHGLTTFLSQDVLRFLGRNIATEDRVPPALKKQVTSDMKARPEGVRIKHRVGSNSIKMYDKQGSVLRVETTINDPVDFKSFRAPEGNPDAPKAWRGMRKGVADLHRRAQVSQAANDRYLHALASVDDARSLGELTTRLCRPVRINGRRFRALNPHAPADAELLQTISSGEFTLNGFRNRDLRKRLYPASAGHELEKRQSAAITRKLALLRAHRLIRKVPATHRYVLTPEGRTITTAIISARNASVDALVKIAA